MAAPLFSIIVPTFNVAATLRTCFDSIVCQTWSDFELVLVDGASTDGTLDIARSFAARLGSRLVIQSGSDDGVYDAMNRGVGLATGAWLLFLGADDSLYSADTLAKVAAFLGQHAGSGVVYGDVVMRSDSARYAGEFDLDRLLFHQNICHQPIFYRRELFAGIGPFLRDPVWADWDFNIRGFSNPSPGDPLHGHRRRAVQRHDRTLQRQGQRAEEAPATVHSVVAGRTAQKAVGAFEARACRQAAPSVQAPVVGSGHAPMPASMTELVRMDARALAARAFRDDRALVTGGIGLAREDALDLLAPLGLPTLALAIGTDSSVSPQKAARFPSWQGPGASRVLTCKSRRATRLVR